MYKAALLLIGVIGIASCGKDNGFSPTPEVEFKSFVNYKDAAGKDTAIDFIFDFKDGDGDIGYKDNELDTNCGADNNNLYIAYEERRGADFYPKKLWLEVTDVDANCDTNVYFDSVQVQFNQRMKYLSPPGNNKSITGTVTYHMDQYSALIVLSASGRFKFYIRDRAGHLSNVVTTPEVYITK